MSTEIAVLGCRGAYVSTTSPDAQRFFESCNYAVKLRLPEIRPGIEQITLQKTF